MLNSPAADKLAAGLTQLGIGYSPQQFEQLLAYAQLLLKWNKVYSLTACRDLDTLIRLHLLDGLAAVPYFATSRNILDVGSGMGVPGVVLAIMLPSSQLTLIDSNSKKTAFLQQVKIELGLTNLTVISARVEDYRPFERFEVITSRAFADLALFTHLTAALLTDGGRYLALKSQAGKDELASLSYYQGNIIKLVVPFLDAQRFLIELKLR